MKKKINKIWMELFELEEEWNRRCDPRFNWYGNMTFRKIKTLDELQRVVEIQERQKMLKRELRKMVGFWAYLHYLFNEVSFLKKYL